MRLLEVLHDKDGAIGYIQEKRECIRNGVCKREAYKSDDTEYIIRKLYPLARVKVSLTAVEAKITDIKRIIDQLWRDEDMAHAYDNLKEYIELREDILRILK